MSPNQVIFLVLMGLFISSEFISLALMFYIGRTRVKEIDKVVYGYEFPHDSIFALMIRVPNYASGFLWKWSARRSGLEDKIEHFDKRFRWPFIAAFLLAIFGMVCLIIALLFEKYFGLK
ncbi:MAG: hypothetical protein COB33_015575 [Thiotrichaceae bacterium]|nr:hypothetical protein [Thiotrichaceae bacterium]